MTSVQPELLRTLTCTNGIIELYSDRIVVHKKGLLSRFTFRFPGDVQTITFNQMLDVKFYPTSLFVNGVLRFITRKGNIMLFFPRKTYSRALEIKDIVEDMISRQKVYPEVKEMLRKS